MKFCLFVIAASALLAVALGDGVVEQLVSVRAQVNALIIKNNVKEAMAAYTYDFDHLIATGGVTNGNTSDPRFQVALDASVSHFCQGPNEFLGWVNWFGGALAGNYTTVAQVRGFYQVLALYVMKNISDHRLSNEIVTIGADGRSAAYKGKLCHDTINAFTALPGDNNVPQPIKDCGHYENVFKVRDDLSVCMSFFYDVGTFAVRSAAQTVPVPAGATSVQVPPSLVIILQDISRI